ncbi:MAG: hypothetical protein GZ093_14330 [Rhodoferax sp.]|uniref:hypothetical protein n=1 Tax=Rhodoferax sp. TaxID=50421 RepID=UPI00140176D7|nr:hypothetical protein [Rhodoferax sp.]NDP39904.1 hypothetical protein [Rhodoferax sp.]
MELTQEGALRAYAKMINTLSTEPIEALLADDFVYESQYVFAALESKQAFLDYMVPKLETVARAKAFVYAEMGTVDAYFENQPCVILAQNEKYNLVSIVLAKVGADKLMRLDLCCVPTPQSANRSGDYPQ